MINLIEFTIKRAELIDTLKFLSPFIGRHNHEDYEEGSLPKLPEPYFYDKVSFYLSKPHAYLSVMTAEGVRVTRTCNVETEIDNLAFCITHDYLLQEAQRYYNSIDLKFKEERFFGFNVYDGISDNHLFDVDAHSTRKQPKIYPDTFDTLFPRSFPLERETLLKALRVFPEYTSLYTMRRFCESIWFFVNDGICRVVATDAHSVRQELFKTEVKGNYTFSIPGKFANKFYDIIVNWTKYRCQYIRYNDNYLSLDYYLKGGYTETIEVPVNKNDLPSLKNVLENYNITHHSSLRLDELKSAIRRKNTDNWIESVIMHFFTDHVNIHRQHTNENWEIHEFYDTVESDGEFIVKLNLNQLEKNLEEVHSDNVIFTLIDDNLLHINNEDEKLFGDIIRCFCTYEITAEDQAFMEKGDDRLRSQSSYIERYLTKNEDDEDEFTKDSLATIDEMKTEAICRMKEVIEYTELIDFFEQTGLPQVYEPPYGASYSLEDDELENVRKIENNRNVLVWGVIRCNMMYNGQEVTVDCMLHVSQDKDEWEQERNDLRSGFPFVYTVMKEYPVTDHGHITVYKSKGGTLLRKLLQQ